MSNILTPEFTYNEFAELLQSGEIKRQEGWSHHMIIKGEIPEGCYYRISVYKENGGSKSFPVHNKDVGRCIRLDPTWDRIHFDVDVQLKRKLKIEVKFV
jgi:hypothetical protein